MKTILQPQIRNPVQVQVQAQIPVQVQVLIQVQIQIQVQVQAQIPVQVQIQIPVQTQTLPDTHLWFQGSSGENYLFFIYLFIIFAEYSNIIYLFISINSIFIIESRVEKKN